MQNKVTASGEVIITVLDQDGKVLARHRNRNLVVDQGLTILAELLGQTAVGALPPENNAITTIRVSTGNTAPTQTDTSLADVGNSVSMDVIAQVNEESTTGLVSFSGTLPLAEGNGLTLREAGLYTESGRLFARQIHGEITKTSAISLNYNWRIRFFAL